MISSSSRLKGRRHAARIRRRRTPTSRFALKYSVSKRSLNRGFNHHQRERSQSGVIAKRAVLIVSVGLMLAACGELPSPEAGGASVAAEALTGGWTATGSLATVRNIPAGAVLPDGRVLITGGYNGTFLTSSQLYDPATGTWMPTGSLMAGRSHFTVTRLQNGKVIAVGGSTSTHLSSVEIYDPATGSWSPTGSLPDTRADHTATLLPDGRVLLVGGNAFTSTEALLYNPAAGTWSSAGMPSTPRTNHIAVLLQNGKVLVAGGSRYGSLLTDTELYDPATNTWTTTGPLNVSRVSAAAALLPDGRVLIVGGYTNGPTVLSSAEVYDPATGTWSMVGSLATPRRFHAATLLNSGRVLISGGTTLSSAVANSEIFDPTTNTFTSIEPMGGPRYGHAALMLQNGEVLVVGGYSTTFLASAERYAESSAPSDTIPPTASITAPAAGATLVGTVTVSANASDNLSVARVEFYRGSTLIGSDTTAPYSISWDSHSVTNGGYTLTAKAYDSSNNVGTSTGVSVTVQNVASETISNGGFEGSANPWLLSGNSTQRNDGLYAHGGTGFNELGVINYASGTTVQQITVPPGSPVLRFWLNVTSSESTTSTRWDNLYIEVLSPQGSLLATLGSFSNLDKVASSTYSQKSFSLASYAGQTLQLRFRATTDSILPTTFRIDDVSVQ